MSNYLLSKNFTLDEFVESSTASRLNIDNTPDFEVKNNLVRLCKEILQPLRDVLQRPIHVTSGYRCKTLNKAVGGVYNSQHCYGLAADICVDSMDSIKLYKRIKELELSYDQLICYPSFVHVSIAGTSANYRFQSWISVK